MNNVKVHGTDWCGDTQRTRPSSPPMLDVYSHQCLDMKSLHGV
jgi:hypothetical protein